LEIFLPEIFEVKTTKYEKRIAKGNLLFEAGIALSTEQTKTVHLLFIGLPANSWTQV